MIQVLEDIINGNGETNYKEMNDNNWAYINSLTRFGVPYNFYLLIQTTSQNGCVDRYCFIRLFEDQPYSLVQKFTLIKLIYEVRGRNKFYSDEYGVAGRKDCLLNCDDKDRMTSVNNCQKYRSIMPWIRSTVLNMDTGAQTDKYGKLQKEFCNEDFQNIENCPIFPIMKLGHKIVTGGNGGNGTEVTIVMGFPIEFGGYKN